MSDPRQEVELTAPTPSKSTEQPPLSARQLPPPSHFPVGPDTSPEAVYTAAKEYVESGLSVIPIRADGSKRPDSSILPQPWDAAAGRYRSSWRDYQARRPTAEELRAWFNPAERVFCNGPPGLAVVTGVVSGGLEVIDFDSIDHFAPWVELINSRSPGLVDRLVRVSTPRPGMHVYLRSPCPGRNDKLASTTVPPDGSTKAHVKTLIETRGEGGYCLVPPSSRYCHPTMIEYCIDPTSPPLTQFPVLRAEERECLLAAARSLNQVETPPSPSKPLRRPAGSGPTSQRPGDDFNKRATWAEVLEPHGWVWVGNFGAEDRWCRPAKSDGVSATTNYGGNDRLHVFSSNAAPFEVGGNYTKFAAFALLMHGGNFKAAAEALRRIGFGKAARWSLPCKN